VDAEIKPRCLTIPAPAAYLSTTVGAVRMLIADGELPHLRVGKRFLIDRAELDELVDARKVSVVVPGRWQPIAMLSTC
jgi:excisionase family DNA binding protein